jgi:hypothetical protein
MLRRYLLVQPYIDLLGQGSSHGLKVTERATLNKLRLKTPEVLLVRQLCLLLEPIVNASLDLQGTRAIESRGAPVVGNARGPRVHSHPLARTRAGEAYPTLGLMIASMRSLIRLFNNPNGCSKAKYKSVVTELGPELPGVTDLRGKIRRALLDRYGPGKCSATALAACLLDPRVVGDCLEPTELDAARRAVADLLIVTGVSTSTAAVRMHTHAAHAFPGGLTEISPRARRGRNAHAARHRTDLPRGSALRTSTATAATRRRRRPPSPPRHQQLLPRRRLRVRCSLPWIWSSTHMLTEHGSATSRARTGSRRCCGGRATTTGSRARPPPPVWCCASRPQVLRPSASSAVLE